MSNVIKLHNPCKAEVMPEQQFKYTVTIEVYLKDRSKKKFEFVKLSEEPILYPYYERFTVECNKHVYSEVDRNNLMVTHMKSYVELPDGTVKKWGEFIPMLHFGHNVESMFI